MIEKFEPRAIVRWDNPNGGLARIIRYEGEGFYLVERLPTKLMTVGLAHEDDLVLVKDSSKGEPGSS